MPANSYSFEMEITIYSAAPTVYTAYVNFSFVYILPTECICVFHMVLKINSDCFPKQH
jgi:hypothetical protein